MCYIQVQGYDKLKFFKEADIYWTPATTTSGLYSQLFEYKYRELLRSQIRSGETDTPYAQLCNMATWHTDSISLLGRSFHLL